jgi:exocyst complex component 4
VNSLTSAQQEVTKSRTSLTEVKESVGNKRADLVQLWTRGQQLEEMIKLMDQMWACFYSTTRVRLILEHSEYLKTVPELLESLMSEKRLLPAAALLMNSLKIIGNENMQEIGALTDLKSYLLVQETVRISSSCILESEFTVVIEGNSFGRTYCTSFSQDILV